MARTRNGRNTIDYFNLIPSILIIAFLLVGFVPNLDAVDKIAPQWLYLSLLNFSSSFYLFVNFKKFQEQISSVISSLMSLVYLLFVIWGALSYFYSINPTEVIVNMVRQFNTFFMFLHLGILLYKIKNKNKLLSLTIMVILSLEVYSVLEQALNMYKVGLIDPGNLKGVTANRNITAFSIAIKIPFIVYLIIINDRILKKILFGFLIFLSLFSISIIQSRASYIAVFLISIIILIYSIYNFYKNRNSKELSINLFYLIPFFLAILFNQILISDKGGSAINRAATIGRGISDNSINQRFRYYQDVFTQIAETPVFGVGLGNWKIKSIYHDRFDIDGYVVPYHAHSDFIQLGAELGLFGFILYLGIFLIAVYFSYYLLFKSSINYDNKWFITILITALGVYFIDANLNFPIARPQVLAPWALTMSLISFYFLSNYKMENSLFSLNVKPLKFFPLVTMILMVFSIFVTYKTFQSHKGQLTLLRDFNTNKYSIPLDKVENITPSIPNITVTTIPMNSIKARYFTNLKKYDKALKLLTKGETANPYLFYSENQKSQIFLNMGKIDSAFVYARKAFYGLPKNALHASTYAQILGVKKDSKELLKAFEVINEQSGPIIWKNFLVILSQILPSKDPNFIKYASKGVELFPNDKEFFSMKKLAVVGQDKVNEATTISQLGLNYFNEKKYVEAALEFEKAAKIDMLEYAHCENAASAFFMAGDYEKTLIYSDRVINQFNPKTGKSEYIRSLVLFNYGNSSEACKLLKSSLDFGYSQAEATYQQRCN